MALSDKAIRALKGTGAEYRIADGGGLYLRVYPTGRKAFFFRSRIAGGAVVKLIGEYPDTSLLQARNAAKALLDRVKRPETITLNQAVELWTAQHKIATIGELKRRLSKHILPKLGELPLVDIRRRDVADILTGVAADNGPVVAKRTLADIKQLFNYAVERDWIEGNQLSPLSGRTIGGEYVPRERVGTEAELRRLIAELRTDRFAPATRWLLVMILLTGQRSQEVRGICAAEFDGRLWVIPRARMKEKHSIQPLPLPLAGRYLLRRMFAELGPHPLEMPGQVPARAMTRIGFDPHLTPHDLRRTMATKMADLGVEPYVIEKCLNHKMAGVLDIYNRGMYVPEKARAYRLWTKYLLKLRKEKT